MRFYTKQHPFYCGIDLHAKTMYVVIVDQSGKVLVERNARADAKLFLEIIEPYRSDVVVAVECIFTWYWLADLCEAEGIAFVLGHALYMKAIHGGKAKNDKIDAHKIAGLLRGGLLPYAYVYPALMRSTRDLLRRRLHLVRKRAELLSHILNTNSQCNLPDFGGRINYKVNRKGIAERFSDPSVRKSIEVDLQLLAHYDTLISDLELFIVNTAKVHDPDTFHRLKSIPGVGKILAMTILYEIHDIGRFDRVQQFASYSRLVKCARESAGKRHGTGGSKIGNVHLKWAFSEAAVSFLGKCAEGRKLIERLRRKHGKAKALSILAHKIGRAVYYMLTQEQAFDINKFVRV
jgi:transposase